MPADGLDAGLEKGQSKYKAYLMYLGHQGLMCGWEWEKEGLRVPSTRGWGIVGMSSQSTFLQTGLGVLIAVMSY